MRLPASEKLEIIRLVEQSHLPARRTLKMLGIKPMPTLRRGKRRQLARSFRQVGGSATHHWRHG